MESDDNRQRKIGGWSTAFLRLRHHSTLLLSSALICTFTPLSIFEAQAQSVTGGAATALPAVTVDAPNDVKRRPTTQSPPRASRPVRAVAAAPRRRPAATVAPRSAQVAPASAPVQVSRPNDLGGARGPVAGFIGKASAVGTKTDTPLIETPQSISVVAHDQLQAQDVQSVSDALRYVTGVQADSNGFDGRADNFRIRGFDQTVTGIYQDGLRLYNFNNQGGNAVEPYGLERIDVLRGPSSVLYGQADPGGVVNLVSKLPTETPFHEVQVQGGTFDRVQGAFDLSGPVVPGDNTVLYRLTGLARSSDTSIDYAKDNRLFLAPAVTFQPDASTTLTLLGSVQQDGLGSAYNVLPRVGTLAPSPFGTLPLNRSVNDPSDFFDRNRYSFTYLFEHHFDDQVTVRQNFRFLDLNTNYQETGFNGLEADGVTAVRSVLAGKEAVKNAAIDTQLEYKLNTGAVKQDLLFGVDGQALSSNSTEYFSSSNPIDVYHPSGGLGPLSYSLITAPHSTLDQVGIYAQDQAKFYDHFIVTAGTRYDWTTTTTTDFAANTTSKQDDSKSTSRVGLTYLTDVGVAPYVSFSQSFLPQIGLAFDGTAFRPTTGTSYEAGVKYQPIGFKALFTAAIFDTTQQNVLTTDLQHLGFSVQTGEVRSEGVELEAKAEIYEGLNVIANYTHVDPRITKDNDGNVGKLLNGASTNIASLWVDYKMPEGVFRGFGIAAGVRYNGFNFGDNANTIKVPGYSLLDGALSYNLGSMSKKLEGFTASVNGTNLTDRRYVSQCGYYGDGCRYGYGRTVLAALRYNW